MRNRVPLISFGLAFVLATIGSVLTLGVSPASASIAGDTYTPLSPIRILDTRLTHQTLGPNSSLSLQVAGVNGVPASASAVAINATVTNTTAPSYLSIYPTGQSLPNVSNLNWTPGITIANLAVVPVGSNGEITFYNDQGNVDVVVDLQGYFTSGSPGSYYVPLSPARICDTRSGSGEPYAGQTLGAGGSLNIQVAGAGGIPTSGVTAAVLNVTVTNTSAPSFLSVYPAGESYPGTSTLNWLPPTTIANRVIVPVGTNGKITVYNAQGQADVIVDVSGYFSNNASISSAASLFYPVNPTRILDTRADGGTLGTQGYFGIQVAGVGTVAPEASAVLANLTATDTTAPGYFNITPSQPAPLTSDLNWLSGVTVANLGIDTLNQQGELYIYNDQGEADAILDVSGYFQPVTPSAATPAVPCTSPAISAPSSITIGSSLSVSVTATCPSGTTPNYTFWYRSPGSVDWSYAGTQTNAAFSYSTSNWFGGTYQVMAWISTEPGIYQQVTASTNVQAIVPPCSGVIVSTSPNPGVVSTPVEITATPQCPGSPTAYYVYWARDNNLTTTWTDLSGWTTSSSWLTSTEGWDAGNYSFLVWISNASGGNPQAQTISNDTLNSSGGFLVSQVAYYHQIYSMNCEETALEMAMTHEGIYLGGSAGGQSSSAQNAVLNAEGVNSGVPGIGSDYPSGNPMSNFIGPPNGGESSTYEPGAYYGAVVKAADHFGAQVIAAGEGISPTQLYRYVEENHPVVVWITFDFAHYNASWYRDYAGDMIPWAGPHEHSVVVIGVGVNSVLINNPWPSDTYGAQYAGQNVWVPMSVFEASYSTYNDMAVVLN